MNVLYRCPICGMKLFALPGGTAIKCMVHTDHILQQVENYNGPDFLDADNSRTGHIVTQGADPKNIPKRKMDFGSVEDTENVEVLGTLYLNETGERADGRWSASRLKTEIANIREFKADKAAREYQEKRAKIAAEIKKQEMKEAEAKAEEEREKLSDLQAYIDRAINAAIANKDSIEVKDG